MKKVFIYSLTCERRSLDAKKIFTYLSKNDYEIVYKPKNADIIIFVTCGALNVIVNNSLKKIMEFQKYDAELIVAGCLPKIEKESLSKIFKGRIIDTQDLNKIDELFPGSRVKFSEIDDENIPFQSTDESKPLNEIRKLFRRIRWIEQLKNRIVKHVVKNIFGKNSRIFQFFKKMDFYHLKISTGCLGNCSYCAIKRGIGPLKSKTVEQNLKEFKKGLDEGYQIFLITADDVGAYGVDIGSSFPELLDKITEQSGEYKISIRHVAPIWIIKYIDDLEPILKRNKIINFGIPIESGSSRILKLMNRSSDIKKMKEVFLRLKNKFPDLILITTYLLGFPSETHEDFLQTLSFIEESRFDAGIIIPFSCRKGTKAEKIELKVSKKQMKKRLKNAKSYLKKAGYHVTYIPLFNHFSFTKKDLM